MAIDTINIGTSPNDGTGDPLRTAFQKTNENFLTITADGGNEITVTDPTTSADAELNVALQNIFDSGGSGTTPTLQEVTTEGNVTNLPIEFDSSGGEIGNFAIVGDLKIGYYFNDAGDLYVKKENTVTGETSLIEFTLDEGFQYNYADGVDAYSLNTPTDKTGAQTFAMLSDITGGVSDGDKGDITVSGGGLDWDINNGVVTNSKVASGIDAAKIADGSVSNTEFQYINSLTSNAQTQLDLRVRTLLNDNVDSSTVTGTVANTILKSYLIPANTLAVGDTLDLKAVCSKTGTNANSNFRLYTNTSNSLTSANALALVSPSATNLYFSLDRTYTLKSGNTLESFPVSATAPTDEVATTTAISNTAFNPAVDNWFIIAIQPNNALDSFKQTLCYITLMKAKTSI